MTVGALLSRTYDEWRADGAPQIAAALTYYVFLSLAPMLVVAVNVLGRYLDRSTITGRVLEQARALAGSVGEGVIRELIASAEATTLSALASAAALVIALFGSMRVFGQLRIAFDRIWDIPRTNAPAEGFWRQLRWGLSSLGKDNLAAFLMVLVVGVLLAASIALSGVLAVAAERLAPVLELTPVVLRAAESVLSLTLVAVLFALIYRVVPRTPVAWRDVWVGAMMTAALFLLGRGLLEVYFANASPGSAYGAAGSVVALLIWVNVSLQIVLFGAEFTQVWARTRGSRADSQRS